MKRARAPGWPVSPPPSRSDATIQTEGVEFKEKRGAQVVQQALPRRVWGPGAETSPCFLSWTTAPSPAQSSPLDRARGEAGGDLAWARLAPWPLEGPGTLALRIAAAPSQPPAAAAPRPPAAGGGKPAAAAAAAKPPFAAAADRKRHAAPSSTPAAAAAAGLRWSAGESGQQAHESQAPRPRAGGAAARRPSCRRQGWGKSEGQSQTRDSAEQPTCCWVFAPHLPAGMEADPCAICP